MLEALNKLKADALGELENLNDLKELDTWRVKYLGRKGIISELMTELPLLDKEKKPIIGKELNLLQQLFMNVGRFAGAGGQPGQGPNGPGPNGS